MSCLTKGRSLHNTVTFNVILGQSEDWIFWVSVVMHTCNVWCNTLSCIWLRNEHQFKTFVDMFISWLPLSPTKISSPSKLISTAPKHFWCPYLRHANKEQLVRWICHARQDEGVIPSVLPLPWLPGLERHLHAAVVRYIFTKGCLPIEL